MPLNKPLIILPLEFIVFINFTDSNSAILQISQPHSGMSHLLYEASHLLVAGATSGQFSLVLNPNQPNFMTMKIKSICLCISASLVILSCSREEPLTNQPDKQENTLDQASKIIGSNEVTMPKVVTFGKFKILKFNTWNEFDIMAKYLAQQQDILEDNFYNQYHQNGMSDDLYNDVIEEVNFSNEVPLQNFENTLGFGNSYRKMYNSELQEWLNNDVLDDDNYPKNKTLFSGSEFSLINDRQQIMIGNTVYQCTKKGYLNISNDYENALNTIDHALINNIDLETLAGWWFINPPKECVLWRKNGEPDVYDGGNYRTYRSCGIRSFTIYTKTLAELESYKKKNNGGWKKYRRSLKVQLAASVNDFDCNSAESSGEVKDKNRSELEANVTFWGGTNSGGESYRAQLGSSIWGGFWYANRDLHYVLN